MVLGIWKVTLLLIPVGLIVIIVILCFDFLKISFYNKPCYEDKLRFCSRADHIENMESFAL